MKLFSWLRRLGADAMALWDESCLARHSEMTKVHKFVHFWLMVGRSFTRNRCFVRASALSYGSLLALVPMLAVVMSVTSTFLKKAGEERIDHFIERLVASVTPPAETGGGGATNEAPVSAEAHAAGGQAASPGAEGSPKELVHADEAIKARKQAAHQIHQFIQNTRSGALGITGTVLLIFAAISMLSRVEDTFNDIWGVAHGRGWFTRIIVYWGVISLAPLLAAALAALANSRHVSGTGNMLRVFPAIFSLVGQLGPVILLCAAFSVFYKLIPNTEVLWKAAVVGGIAGGVLLHINNMLSVLYVSRVISASRIYGALGLVPVFMIGMYFAWLIVLFGAQVAYGYQNRTTYVEEKQLEQINQRGREFVALRLMTRIGQRFLTGEPALGVVELGKELGVPTRLAQQILRTLNSTRLVEEVADREGAYVPARPLETITCHDVLMALRVGQGQGLVSHEEPGRAEIYGEFERIEEAERQAASAVTLLSLVNRTGQRQLEGGHLTGQSKIV